MSHMVQDAHRTSQYYLDIITVIGYLLLSACCVAVLLTYSSLEFSFLNINFAMGAMLTNGAYWLVSLVYLALWLFVRKRFKEVFYKRLKYLNRMEEWSAHKKDQQINQYVPVENPISRAIEHLQSQITDASNNEINFDHMIREGAMHDRETGIGNRAFFTSRLEALLKEEEVYGGVCFIQFNSLEYLDVQYGHEKVLDLLNSYIDVIKQKVEGVQGYFIARRSEDELSILLPRMMVPELKRLVDSLLSSLLKVPTPIGVDTEEFIHIGVSYFHGEQSAYQIKAEADMALRSAQLQGPSQWFMYDIEEMEYEAVKGSLRWRTFLLKMINKKAFVLFFQPVISAHKNTILHQEILCKVKEHTGKLLNAKVFIPMAQKCGLTVEIDTLILEKVCHILRYENNHEDLFSINLSVDALLSPSLMNCFKQQLMLSPDIGKRLIIEVTEYHLSHHIDALTPVLNRLHKSGVRVLVDKVGQYVVSAEYIKAPFVSHVKLHRSIVLNVHEKTENQIFIQSLLNLSKPLGVKVYGVGVEHKKEWDMLLQLGIDGGQGYYFTKPVDMPFLNQEKLQYEMN